MDGGSVEYGGLYHQVGWESICFQETTCLLPYPSPIGLLSRFSLLSVFLSGFQYVSSFSVLLWVQAPTLVVLTPDEGKILQFPTLVFALA